MVDKLRVVHPTSFGTGSGYHREFYADLMASYGLLAPLVYRLWLSRDQSLEQEAGKARDSKQLIAAMRKRYPNLADESSLELSAQVIKGEVQWPQ